MICKKCGTTNDDNQKVCGNCGAILYSIIEIKWQGILAGVIAGLVFLLIAYTIYGLQDGWIYMSLLFSSMIAGAFATIFSKRDNVPTIEDDYNLILHSFLAGTIFFLVAFPIMSTNPMILLYAPGFGMLSIIGAILGYLINIARERDIKWKIGATTVSVLLAALVIYIVFFSNLHDEQKYDNKVPVCLSELYSADGIDSKTKNFSNNTPIYNIDNKNTLKELKLQYQEMKNFTQSAYKISQDLLKYASSPIEEEYGEALKKYSELRLNYYTKMELATTLTLKGDKNAAKKQYNNAQTLLIEIKSQNTTLTTIQNKDPSFRSKIEPLINKAKIWADKILEEAKF